MTNRQIIAFNKRFAAGEQNIELGADGKIINTEKEYYWQQQAVYNQIGSLVNLFKQRYLATFKSEKDFDNAVYGKGGLVDKLIPLQRAYNTVRNQKHEFMKRLALGVIFVEDGSVDVDELTEDGVLEPGAVTIYRQGSQAPKIVTPSIEEANVYDSETCILVEEMTKIFESFQYMFMEGV